MFINLIGNEWRKNVMRTGTLFMLGGLLVLLLISAVMVKGREKQNTEGDKDWTKQMEISIQSKQQILKDGGIPNSYIQKYQNQIEEEKYRLEHNLPLIQSSSIYGFMEGSADFNILIALFAVIIAGAILPGEYASGTIKLLMIRPWKRYKILGSKYLVSVIFPLCMMAILMLVSFIIAAVFFGIQGLDSPYLLVKSGKVTEQNMMWHLIQLYLLKSTILIILVTFTFMLAVLSLSSAVAIALGVFATVAGNSLTAVLSRYDWAKYLLFSNMDLSQYLKDTPPIDGMTMGFSAVVLVIYFVIMNAVSFLYFQKRDIAG